jgi:hypothetical protein
VDLNKIDRGVAEVIFFALDHGISSVRESDEPLVPFVLIEK